MPLTPLNDDELLIAAGLDDELDAAASLALQRRLDADPAFRAVWEVRRALREAVRERASYHAAPAGLRGQIEAALGFAMDGAQVEVAATERTAAATAQAREAADESAPAAAARRAAGESLGDSGAARRSDAVVPTVEPRAWSWRRAARRGVAPPVAPRPWGYAFGGALVATLATLLAVEPGALRPGAGGAPAVRVASAATTDAAEAVNAHARAILVGQPIEVVSSDQHTVRPWLSARLSFVPQVVDFAPQGYPLAGARRDVIAGETTAVLVYRHGAHVVSVFVRPADAPDAERLPAASGLRGFNVIEMAHAGMRYCLVSDMNPRELADLVALLRHPPGA